MRARGTIVAAALGVAVLAACGRDDDEAPPPPKQGVLEVMSEAKAIELAREACAGKAEIPEGVQARATFAAGKYIVIFPTNHPAGKRGADYHAKVTLNARTGAIIELLGGN